MGTPTAVCFHGIQKVGVLEMGQRAVSMGFLAMNFPWVLSINVNPG
jgi:hypothetical protein